MRPLLTAGLVIAVAAVMAAPAVAGIRTVGVGDDYFIRPGAPPVISVRRGTTVRFLWLQRSRHNVTFASGPATFHPVTANHGYFYRKLTVRGTYRIICTLHPGMKMTLKVR